MRIQGEERRMSGEPEPEKGTAEYSNSLQFRPVWQKSVVFLAGVFLNLVLGWLLFSGVRFFGTPSLIIVQSVQDNSPAAISGIKTGDVISGYDSVYIFINTVRENGGKDMELNIVRDDKPEQITVKPRMNPSPGEGALGVGLAEVGVAKESFFSAFAEGGKDAWYAVSETARALYMTIKQLILAGSVPEGIVGPVGIVEQAGRTAAHGFAYAVQLFAFISVNLAVINILPIPALDGGKFVMTLLERARRRALPYKVELYLQAGSFLLLVLLILVLTVRDIIRL